MSWDRISLFPGIGPLWSSIPIVLPSNPKRRAKLSQNSFEKSLHFLLVFSSQVFGDLLSLHADEELRLKQMKFPESAHS